MSAGTPGVINCVGRSGQTYAKQTWFTDAANSQLRFDQGVGVSATLGETWCTFPEDVVIKDILITAIGTPAATFFRLVLDGVPTSQQFCVAAQLASVAFRVQLNLSIPKGSRLSGIMNT
jgi:hypothetical protein